MRSISTALATPHYLHPLFDQRRPARDDDDQATTERLDPGLLRVATRADGGGGAGDRRLAKQD